MKFKKNTLNNSQGKIDQRIIWLHTKLTGSERDCVTFIFNKYHDQQNAVPLDKQALCCHIAQELVYRKGELADYWQEYANEGPRKVVKHRSLHNLVKKLIKGRAKSINANADQIEAQQKLDGMSAQLKDIQTQLSTQLHLGTSHSGSQIPSSYQDSAVQQVIGNHSEQHPHTTHVQGIVPQMMNDLSKNIEDFGNFVSQQDQPQKAAIQRPFQSVPQNSKHEKNSKPVLTKRFQQDRFLENSAQFLGLPMDSSRSDVPPYEPKHNQVQPSIPKQSNNDHINQLAQDLVNKQSQVPQQPELQNDANEVRSSRQKQGSSEKRAKDEEEDNEDEDDIHQPEHHADKGMEPSGYDQELNIDTLLHAVPQVHDEVQAKQQDSELKSKVDVPSQLNSSEKKNSTLQSIHQPQGSPQIPELSDASPFESESGEEEEEEDQQPQPSTLVDTNQHDDICETDFKRARIEADKEPNFTIIGNHLNFNDEDEAELDNSNLNGGLFDEDYLNRGGQGRADDEVMLPIDELHEVVDNQQNAELAKQNEEEERERAYKINREFEIGSFDRNPRGPSVQGRQSQRIQQDWFDADNGVMPPPGNELPFLKTLQETNPTIAADMFVTRRNLRRAYQVFKQGQNELTNDYVEIFKCMLRDDDLKGCDRAYELRNFFKRDRGSQGEYFQQVQDNISQNHPNATPQGRQPHQRQDENQEEEEDDEEPEDDDNNDPNA